MSNTEQMVSVPTECQFHNNCGGWCEAPRQVEHNLCEHCLESHDEDRSKSYLDSCKAVSESFPFKQPAAQHQSEPIGEVVTDHRGDFAVQLYYGPVNNATVNVGDKVYLHPPTSDGFSAGDMADQGAKAFAARDPEVQELRAKLAERENQCANLRATINAVRTVFEDNVDVVEYIDALTTGSAEPSEPVESDQGIPGTSFQRLNMLANQGE